MFIYSIHSIQLAPHTDFLFIYFCLCAKIQKKTSITHRQKYLFNRGEICFMKMKLLLVGFLFAIISTANSMRFANEL